MLKFIILIIGGFFICFIQDIIIRFYSKRCNYICDKCGVYDCPSKACNKLRKENENG